MSEGYIDKDTCTFSSYRNQRLSVYILTFLTTVLMTGILVGQLNSATVDLLASTFASIVPGFSSNIWVPAILEEFTARTLPAIYTLLLFRLVSRGGRCYRIRDEAYRLGAIGAFAMGLTEFLIRPKFGSEVAYLAPLVMHMIAGTLNFGTFYRVFGDYEIEGRDVVAYTGALFIAIAIHFVFNTWVQTQREFWVSWTSTVGIPVTTLVVIAIGLIGADVIDEYLKSRAGWT